MKLLLICLISLLKSTLSTSDYFDFNCKLELPKKDSTFPTINLEQLDLQVTHRVTHQLVTRVFAIFLKEVYEYKNISIIDLDEKLKDISGEDLREFFPLWNLKDNTAMNLEVWVAPISHLMFPLTVTQGSTLSKDPFKYGLFIQEEFGSRTYSYEDFIASSSSYQKIKEDFKIILESNESKYLHNNSLAHYSPPQCESETEPCAVVLTSHKDDIGFFEDHVKKLKLKMRVFYFGDQLPVAISRLNSIRNARSKQMKYLILHWTPSEIINGPFKYNPVTMPSCELYKGDSNKCQYELNSVSIYFNDKVKSTDNLIEVITYMQFQSLLPLLDLYQENYSEIQKFYLYKKAPREGISNVTLENIYNNIACKWLQNNKQVYSANNTLSWVPGKPKKKKIHIAGIFPLENTGREYDGIDAALRIAQEVIDDNPEMLPGYELSVKKKNVDCKPDLVLREFIDFYSERKHLVGVLGPSCSEAVEPIAAISKHFKTSVITYAAEGISLDNSLDQFPYFFRTIGQSNQYEDVYEKLFTELNWKRLAALTEDSMKYTEYITNMEAKLKEKEIVLLVNKKFNRVPDKAKQFENFKTHLKELRDIHRAKIIIADVHDHNLMKLIICASSKMEMTAEHGFVWFLPVYISMKLNETGFQDINVTCSEKEMRSALDGHLAFDYVSFGNDLDVIPGNQTIKQWKEKYLKETSQNQTQFGDYAGFTYDAIWVYVKALQQLINEDSQGQRYMAQLDSGPTMEKLASLIRDMDFQGVSGRIQFVDGNSRLTDINILQWQGNNFVQVGTYTPKIANRTFVDSVLTLTSQIKWFRGETPTDGTESCNLKFFADAFGIDCQTIYTILIIALCIFVVLLCSASSFLFWKRKYDKKMEISNKFLGNYRTIVNGIELTKWEIDRENVVMNRILGEGAFGTVYGGDARIDDSDDWTPVAVKTLKTGSNAENRLDFLAESETMKRFDHKNIVKLLAVCLQSEPLYAIMEYMLYGDLKTFLLARRHLVNDKLSDDSDVCPKRLTLMALDVARGLSYLSSMNYVHRDIACRNCMINQQRIVKIGDFGMARPTFESDYYRFARRGMLPVRWMAPESLDGGIFSHGSDIWSYGVLLYEIVTLGAFPFQGLNNNEVFEHVKLGNSIKIPATCKPQLKALMSSCFSIDLKKRPGASTIVEFISNYPRMLTPNMDVPKPCLDDQVNLIDGGDNENFENFNAYPIENRDRSHTPAANNFLRASVSSSAIPNHHQVNHPDPFEYVDMKMPKRINGMMSNDNHPDLTATLPNGNYNPVEPLLYARQEISKSNLSLMKYMPMCGFGKSNRSSPDECTSAI